METRKAVAKVEGKLAPKALADLLKRLEGNRGAAYLLVSDGLSERCLYFSVGAIRLTSMGKRRGTRIEDALSAHPSVDPRMVKLARMHQAETGEPFEEVLATQFSLNEVVRECSTAIVRDEVLDLLYWEGAYYEYAEANPPPKIFDPRLEAVKLSFGVNKLLKEMADSIPKAQKLLARVGSGKTRILPGPSWTEGAPPDAEEALCVAIAEAIPDNGALFDDVLLAGRRAAVDVFRAADAIEKMLERKTIEVAKKGQAVPTRDEEIEVAKRDIVDIENALDVMINEMVARQRLAQGYLAVGDQPRAVYNLKRVGDELLQRNKPDEAIETFRQVVKAVPHDFGVREKIAYLYEKMKKIPEAIAEGLDLAKLYKQFGLFNRAKNIFRRVIALQPENIDHRRELIDLLVKLKDNNEAVAEYEHLAEIYARNQDEQGLLAVYQRILALDPGHQGAKTRTQAIVRRRPGFWVPYVAVAAGFFVLVATVAYFSGKYRTVRAFKETRRLAYERADQKPVPDYDGARRVIDDFLRVYDSGRMAEKARSLQAQIAALEEERRVRQAREEYEVGVQLFTGGRPDKARERFASAMQVGRGTDWERKATDRVRDIDKLSEDADRLLSRVRQHEGDQNLREAFERARELVRRFGWTDAAARLTVRLPVTSMPSGAAVSVDAGHVRGRTPYTLTQPGAEPFHVELALQGYQPARRKIDLRDDLPFPLQFDMQRATRWERPVFAKGPIEAPPLVEEDSIFFAARDQRVYALDLAGRVRWERALGLVADAAGRPVRAGQRIIVGDRTGIITALESSEGKVLWRAKMRGVAVPILAPTDALVVVADEGGVAGLEASSGREKWRVALPGGLAALPTPGEGDGTIVAPSGEGFLHILDAATGAERAKISTGARVTAPVGVSSGGYVVAIEGELVRYIAKDGRKVWETRSPGPVVSAPLLAGGAAFFGAGNVLVALEIQDGKERWLKRETAAIQASPAFRANRLYAATGDGRVFSVTAESGTPRWAFKTQGEIVAQPVCAASQTLGGVAETTVFVASTDFGLYAIRD